MYLSHGWALGKERAIIPLLWDETGPTDARTEEQAKMLAMIMTRQVVRWDELQHQNSTYPGYFAAVSKLAQVIKSKLQGD